MAGGETLPEQEIDARVAFLVFAALPALEEARCSVFWLVFGVCALDWGLEDIYLRSSLNAGARWKMENGQWTMDNGIMMARWMMPIANDLSIYAREEVCGTSDREWWMVLLSRWLLYCTSLQQQNAGYEVDMSL